LRAATYDPINSSLLQEKGHGNIVKIVQGEKRDLDNSMRKSNRSASVGSSQDYSVGYLNEMGTENRYMPPPSLNDSKLRCTVPGEVDGDYECKVDE
jgi:hypothetical protein